MLTQAEVEIRTRALRLGLWLGAGTVAAVTAGLALDPRDGHRPLLLGLTLAAAAFVALAARVPWSA